MSVVTRLRGIRQVTVQVQTCPKNSSFGRSLRLRQMREVRERFPNGSPRRVFRLSLEKITIVVTVTFANGRPMAQKVPGVWYFPKKPRSTHA